ncbi:MAG: hypothetical protein AUK47_08380 [Deltaproteobacteria bacterium CG2_30_63_29]|nr:MAG: hypothetical protein AUK47_08380 [Deltaproteobacteria bacterium CG2_30_63_29]
MSWGFAMLLLTACNSTDGQRFRDQEEWQRFDSQTYVLQLHGARFRQPAPEVKTFVCPDLPGDITLPINDISVFDIDATSPTPLLEVDLDYSRTSTQCSDINSEQIGIMLKGLPVGSVDLFRRCDETDSNRFVTRCASVERLHEQRIVESCVGAEPEECEQVVWGQYDLIAYSEYLDDPACTSDENRNPGQGQTPSRCEVCDALSPIRVNAAYITSSPTSEYGQECCGASEEQPPHLAFCVRPCACRKTRFTLKAKAVAAAKPAVEPPTLKIAVLSDIEGNTKTAGQFVDQALERGVDFVVNIGDISASGGQSGLRSMSSWIDAHLRTLDGESCSVRDADRVCCAAGESRTYPNFCGARLNAPPLMNGLGENETSEESFVTFFEEFGPSSFSAFVGRVQLIMLDSADATLGSSQYRWLANNLKSPVPESYDCSVATQEGGAPWPVLAECAPRGDCVDCISGSSTAARPLCIPPEAGRDDPTLSRPRNLRTRNCVCVPPESVVCPYNFTCADDGDGTQSCRCSRDTDCGPGGRCSEGACLPPLRFLLTHTPPFDILGARNSAFRSRREAARLVAILARNNVGLIFAGSINTYAEVAIAGIPTFITGGGGADMESFDTAGHHWLLVTVQDPFGNPRLGNVSIERISMK